MPQDRVRLAKCFQELIGSTDNATGRVNNILGRYQQIIKEAMPTLTEKEWLAIMDTNRGTVHPTIGDTHQEVDPAHHAWMNMVDSDPDEMQDKWGVDVKDLGRKMADMSFVEQCGVMEVILHFWERSNQGESYEEKLLNAGARVA